MCTASGLDKSNVAVRFFTGKEQEVVELKVINHRKLATLFNEQRKITLLH